MSEIYLKASDLRLHNRVPMASLLIPGEQSKKRGSGNEVGSYLSKRIKTTIYYTLEKDNTSLPSRTLENQITVRLYS